MGFLNRQRAPNELPDLAIETSGTVAPKVSAPPKPIVQAPEPRVEAVAPEVSAPPKPIVQAPEPRVEAVAPNIGNVIPEAPKQEVRGENYLEFAHPSEVKQDIKQQISENVGKKNVDPGFFDQILEDINGEISDLGHLEEWYNKKFLPQDVVSNMRNYWEKNKAGMLIQSFGEEYKKKINEKIKVLQALEEDWRAIYFELIKKENVMKKEEGGLKEILSEFVELCRTKKVENEEKPKEESGEKIEKESDKGSD